MSRASAIIGLMTALWCFPAARICALRRNRRGLRSSRIPCVVTQLIVVADTSRGPVGRLGRPECSATVPAAVLVDSAWGRWLVLPGFGCRQPPVATAAAGVPGRHAAAGVAAAQRTFYSSGMCGCSSTWRVT